MTWWFWLNPNFPVSSLTLQKVTENWATTTIESTFSGGLKLAGAWITGVGNLRLRDSASWNDWLAYLDWWYYKFLTADENPAILEWMWLSIADGTSPAMKWYIWLNADNFFLLNWGWNYAQLNTGGIGIWDVMDSWFSTIKLDNHQFQFKDSWGAWASIATGGQLFMYDIANDGMGYIEHSDSDYIFKNYAGALTRVVASELNLTWQMLADNAYLGSVTTLGNYLQLFAVNRRMTIGNLGIAWGNFLGISFDNSPSVSTYAIMWDGASTYLNAKTSGLLYFRINNVGVGSYSSTLQTSNVPLSIVGASPNLTLESSAWNAVNAGTITMRTPWGAEYFTQTFDASANRFRMTYWATNIVNITSSGFGLWPAFSPSYLFDLISTTSSQYRVGYNTSNYFTARVLSTGWTVFSGVWAFPSFDFQFSGISALQVVQDNIFVGWNTGAPTIWINGADTGMWLTAGNYATYECGMYSVNGDETIASYDYNEGEYYYFNRNLHGTESNIISQSPITVVNSWWNQLNVWPDFDNHLQFNVDANGNVSLVANSTSITPKFSFNHNIIVPTTEAPATSSSTWTAGEIAVNASYIFVCTALNTWKRAALSSF